METRGRGPGDSCWSSTPLAATKLSARGSARRFTPIRRWLRSAAMRDGGELAERPNPPHQPQHIADCADAIAGSPDVRPAKRWRRRDHAGVRDGVCGRHRCAGDRPRRPDRRTRLTPRTHDGAGSDRLAIRPESRLEQRRQSTVNAIGSVQRIRRPSPNGLLSLTSNQ